MLSINQTLKLPTDIVNDSDSDTETNIYYTVKSGDTLYNIAKKYDTTVDKLKNINNLTSNLLSIGQVLNVTSLKTYTVKSGDTLYSIAKKYDTTVSEIMSLNNLTSSNLSIGTVLYIP